MELEAQHKQEHAKHEGIGADPQCQHHSANEWFDDQQDAEDSRGILLVIEPLIGAVVLTLWVGAYALVFGVFLLVLGFQLHSKREAQLRKAPAAAKKA